VPIYNPIMRWKGHNTLFYTFILSWEWYLITVFLSIRRDISRQVLLYCAAFMTFTCSKNGRLSKYWSGITIADCYKFNGYSDDKLIISCQHVFLWAINNKQTSLSSRHTSDHQLWSWEQDWNPERQDSATEKQFHHNTI